MSFNSTSAVSLLATVAALGCLGIDARGCSRVLWADNGQAVVVGRNMDWLAPIPADLWVLPRGIKREGMTGKNTLTWTARYGSVIAAVRVGSKGMDEVAAASDGLNEKGFAGHLLWLAESDYGTRDEKVPGLNVALWLQYYLDNCASVDDAIKLTERVPFQVVTGMFGDNKVAVHLALEDSTGDSAVIEYIDGRARIYHAREYTVMTNSPTFDKQLDSLRQYQGFGGPKPIPGSTKAPDRFVRAAYYGNRLPKPKDYLECVAGVMSVMRNIAQPFGQPDDQSKSPVAATRWRTVCDLTNTIYFFESTTGPNIVWVKLKELDFAEQAPVKKLAPMKEYDLRSLDQGHSLVGNCSKKFDVARPFVVPPPG